jgi:tetratricopeptide (TPR) repeat protein
MIVRNEEEHLSGCLDNARPFVDEIVVVDTGSTDRTAEIAKAHGGRVFHHPWQEDFAAARNESLSHATGDWILVLDADERLTTGSGDLMLKLVRDPEVAAYFVKLICPKQDDGGMVRLGWLPRLFRNRIGARFQGIIHEQVMPSLVGKGKLLPSEISLDHKGYLKTPEEMQAKAHRNIRLLERQVNEEPRDSMAWFHLAETLSGVGRLDEAIASYRKAIHLSVLEEFTFSDPIAAVAYQNLGSALIAQGKIDEGIVAVRKAIDILPALASAHVHLGQAYYRKNEMEVAIEHLTRAIELAERPETPDQPFQMVPWLAWFYLGSAQAQLGRLDAALESFRRAVRLKPDFKYARRLLGLAALRLGYPALAFEHLDAARELGGDDARLYISLGSARGNLGDLEGAVQEFQKALDREPGSSEARFNLSLAYRGLARWGKLLDEGRALLEAGAESPEIYRLLGEACAALEAWPQAVVMFESLLAMSSTPVVEDLLNLAVCRLADGKPAEALEVARKAADMDPSASQSWPVIARCHSALGQMGEALAAWERACAPADRLAQTIP